MSGSETNATWETLDDVWRAALWAQWSPPRMPTAAELRSLVTLDCEDRPLLTLDPLALMPRLRTLNIGSTPVRDLGPLRHLKELEVLVADFCAFVNLAPLASLLRLRVIDVSCALGDMRDLEPLADLSRLEELYVAHSGVASVAPLWGLERLRILSLVGACVPLAEAQRFQRAHPGCQVWHHELATP